MLFFHFSFLNLEQTKNVSTKHNKRLLIIILFHIRHSLATLKTVKLKNKQKVICDLLKWQKLFIQICRVLNNFNGKIINFFPILKLKKVPLIK